MKRGKRRGKQLASVDVGRKIFAEWIIQREKVAVSLPSWLFNCQSLATLITIDSRFWNLRERSTTSDRRIRYSFEQKENNNNFVCSFDRTRTLMAANHAAFPLFLSSRITFVQLFSRQKGLSSFDERNSRIRWFTTNDLSFLFFERKREREREENHWKTVKDESYGPLMNLSFFDCSFSMFFFYSHATIGISSDFGATTARFEMRDRSPGTLFLTLKRGTWHFLMFHFRNFKNFFV